MKHVLYKAEVSEPNFNWYTKEICKDLTFGKNHTSQKKVLRYQENKKFLQSQYNNEYQCTLPLKPKLWHHYMEICVDWDTIIQSHTEEILSVKSTLTRCRIFNFYVGSRHFNTITVRSIFQNSEVNMKCREYHIWTQVGYI